MYTIVSAQDGSRGHLAHYACNIDDFLRWPTDPDTANRLNIETARDYRFDQVDITGVWMVNLRITYHSIVVALNGTVSGSAGGTVTLDARRTDTGERIAKTTQVGNGTFQILWYDNTVNVAVAANEDATHAGESAIGLAA
jgi:hypothetical protein